MNENDGLLDFLTDGLVGRERDAVTRAFYQYAAGDPNSHPVGISVLLTACMRKLAQVPEKLQSAATTYQKVVADAREFEKGLIERTNRSNAGVVAEFKDETARVITNMRTAGQLNAEIASESGRITKAMERFLATGEVLLSNLSEIKGELKTNGEAAKKLADSSENAKDNSRATKEIVAHLSHLACTNWLTIGIGVGFVLTLVATHLPWWAAILALGLPIGLLQAIAGAIWTSAKKTAEGMKVANLPDE
jgi:hypothetical protein